MKEFKEYCIKNGIAKNTSNTYSSLINTGIKALKKIIPNDYNTDVELVEYFLKNKEKYKIDFENERGGVVDCFQDFVSSSKKYLEFLNCKKPNNDLTNKKNMQNNIPKNQILYGPPGTGKTYSTVSKALKILNPGEEQQKQIDEIKQQKSHIGINDLKDIFKSQVEFITFHQSFSYEDFVEGLKAEAEKGEISYDIKPGIFKEICNNARIGSSFEECYIKLIDDIKDNEEPLRLKTKQGNVFAVSVNRNGNLNLYTGKDLVKQGVLTEENLKKELLCEDKFDGWQSYFSQVLQYLKDKYDLKKNTENKNYVLIIDEINRGNISQIFGELITLLEESKRAGQDEEITLQLPYSKESFSVPDNLYIIGTMNTADRSLTMMDTALRRRFDFIEMLPNPDLINGSFDGIDVSQILAKINERVEILYDREHLIGHAFLMNVDNLKDLKNAFKNKILPLLEEYFYDDFEKINLVLGSDSFYKNQLKN
jgi:5-methylcytosine-specific restriction protein B